MESPTSNDLGRRVENWISAWRIVVERVEETESSILAFGQRDNQQVVLKVIRNRGDEWRSAEIVDAFQGNGVVTVYDYVEGAMLLERLTPGHSLATMAVSGADDDATVVLAATINAMSPRPLRDAVPTVQDWGKGFERYAASGDTQIPRRLLSAAHQLYLELCASQTCVRLLHGDLHHGNVLFDAKRGWAAVDPKGVIGEIEYEVGAALRNPSERPDLFADPAVIQRRVERFTRELGLAAARAQSWAFAQAVLAAIWGIEDGIRVEPDHGWLALANALLPILVGTGGVRTSAGEPMSLPVPQPISRTVAPGSPCSAHSPGDDSRARIIPIDGRPYLPCRTRSAQDALTMPRPPKKK